MNPLPLLFAASAATLEKREQLAMEWQGRVTHFIDAHGSQLIGAAGIAFAGFVAAHYAGKLAAAWLAKRSMEPPVRMLIERVVRLLVLALAVVIALGTAGVEVAPLVAGIGVVGVGVGLAMQGVLGNLVAGLLIIFTKPFRVGEYIELLGVHGQVTTVELFSTTLAHADRSRVIIPNRKIVGEILHNYGVIRQLDLSVGVSYQTKMEEALALVRDILQKNPRVLREPAPVFGVSTLADSSIIIAIKPWTSVADFGPAAAEINASVLERFRASGISIPLPQREVRLLNSGAA